MSINCYDIGDTGRVTGLFYDSAAALADPGTLTFTFMDPDGNTTAYTYGVDGELVKSATGTFYVDIVFDQRGMWHYRWEASGARVGAQEGQFAVKPQNVPT